MPQENIHINVYEHNKKDIETTQNSSEKYIILMNEELNNQNKDYLIEIEQHENRIEELENDIDREEKKTVYMRGILKNFYYLNTKEKQLNKEYKKELNENFNKLTNFINFIKIFPSILITCLFPCLSFTDLIFPISIILLYIITFFISYYFSTNKFFNKKDFIVQNSYPIIKSISDEIHKMEKNNDNINEFIDCI